MVIDVMRSVHGRGECGGEYEMRWGMLRGATSAPQEGRVPTVLLWHRGSVFSSPFSFLFIHTLFKTSMEMFSLFVPGPLLPKPVIPNMSIYWSDLAI